MSKKILIAIPTARYIEPETFKSIYNLNTPIGYSVDFQYFYGYRVDQVRNLIADWAKRNSYSHVFFVDHDITFPPDTLERLISYDKPVISGVYRQRNEEQHLEIYGQNYTKTSPEDLYSLSNFVDGHYDLIRIAACGFGCALVKTEVFSIVGYPQFEYHVALDHNNTLSEDVDFCRKVNNKNLSVWCDRSVVCGHIGSKTFEVVKPPLEVLQKKHFKDSHDFLKLPDGHIRYLELMARNGRNPKTIFDIGSCVLHWYDQARRIWPDAKVIPFDAMTEVASLYDSQGIDEYIVGAVLSDTDLKEIDFYQNLQWFAGNSVYRENPTLSPLASSIFTDNHIVKKKTITLDTLVGMYNLPKPDLIKMDVQGSELDILRGATKTLESCTDLILELQTKDYNMGAPQATTVIEYLKTIGFTLVGNSPFNINGKDTDADYHFKRVL